MGRPYKEIAQIIQYDFIWFETYGWFDEKHQDDAIRKGININGYR